MLSKEFKTIARDNANSKYGEQICRLNLEW